MEGASLTFAGSVIRLGDDVDTDAIFPAKHLSLTRIEEIAAHCLENEFPGFPALATANPIVVAGRNFGCGSSREHAPLAMKGCGVSCVVAQSVSRIFFRNAVNIGLPVIELPKVGEIASGDFVEMDLSRGVVNNVASGKRYVIAMLPDFMRELLLGGGILPYIEKRLESVER